MKIFLSHSSRQKPLVREIRRLLPEHVDTWLDEQSMFFGDEVSRTLEQEISESSDYLLLFLDVDAAESDWVRKEVEWALAAEAALSRTILLVVVIEQRALHALGIDAIKDRKFITCTDFSERGVEFVANSIVADLFAIACRELESIQNPTTEKQVELIKGADEYLESASRLCINILFPYRSENPITKNDFFDLFQKETPEEVPGITISEVLDELFEKGLLPGVSYDGYELFIQEEHYKWKSRVNTERKAAVARVAAKKIRSGDTIAIDAGSATDELVRVICSKFTSRSLGNLTIVTNSMSAVEMLLNAADLKGFDEHSCPFLLYLVGGYVRPNTRAIARFDENEAGSFLSTLRHLGGADLGFVGVNGVDFSAGLTTHENAEVKNKQDIISSSKNALILGDSSKIGVVAGRKFSDFGDDVEVYVDKSAASEKLFEMARDGNATVVVV